MNNKKPIIAYEHCTLYIEGQPHRVGDIPMDYISFKNLWNFILSNKTNDDADVIMSVHTRGGRKYIRTGRYVGTIQTKDGQIIEVLPKIYKASGQQEGDKEVCRRVFLNMLRHFTEAKARSFQKASLSTKRGFPILEVYIRNYANAVEELILGGIKKNYSLVEENQRYLKGKLNISRQITRNAANKAIFAIKYNNYIDNIPQNRVIVTTLRKLLNDSHSSTNKSRISSLLTVLADIPLSYNVENDLKVSNSTNRLFKDYNLLIMWSSQFLLNKGFTTFAGNFVNQSLLFQANRLFEDFITYLFKKFAPQVKFQANTQNTRYFLVDRHNGRKMFNLRPDILLETNSDIDDYECIIIDTKWKALDSTKPDKNYLLDMKDMYQLYAYGQKYRLGESMNRNINVAPKLVLLYPYSEKFTKELPTFRYDELENEIGLKLNAIPFNLAEPNTYQAQIENIIQLAKEN